MNVLKTKWNTDEVKIAGITLAQKCVRMFLHSVHCVIFNNS